MSAASVLTVEQRVAPTSLRDLASFRNRHAGETIIVCGCGESLNELERPEQFTTIGVNDIGRRFHPNYLVVVNPRAQFAKDRWSFVERSEAGYLFTQLADLPVKHPRVVRFKLGKRGGTDFANPHVLHYTQNSPYVAVCLAAYMGAKRIGLIGVDFTDHHFFGKTGHYALSPHLPRIDQEYGRLVDALRARGVEVVNLSSISRLTTIPKRSINEWVSDMDQVQDVQAPPASKTSRVFVAGYRFLSAGDVFSQGLRHAASELGVEYEEALWDDSTLPSKVLGFGPDLMLVVHGRRFAQRWGTQFAQYRTAVWLVDEPYEVDDTAKWSPLFNTVFVNDPATLARHRNAHYLPVCYDTALHRASQGQERPYQVGFIGGYNRVRERYLLRLAQAGVLSYVVGGPWKSPLLQRMTLATNVTPERTAELYRATKIVVNVFRETHHFNRQRIPAWSMNPRVYEALACGAVVISERRPELSVMFPEMPLFSSDEELLALTKQYLDDQGMREDLLGRCQQRLQGHSYADRLRHALAVCLKGEEHPLMPLASRQECSTATQSLTAYPLQTPRAIEKESLSNVTALPAAAGSEFKQFQGSPRRNLLYHIWPVRNSLWRWNVEQLLKRIELFNGKRVISVFVDERTESEEAVRAVFAGHGCEFLVRPNDPRGEAAVFPDLLERVNSVDPNEVTFYAHAKGVRYGSQVTAPLRKWIETLYRVNLDDWLAVKRQLNRYSMTGAFKMYGRFATHRQMGDWHYSGTYFWFRNQAVFSKNYLRVPDFYYGVEAWPGLLFEGQQTGCLFMDRINEPPYLQRFWQRAGDRALAAWASQTRGMVPPSDLVSPVPYEGYGSPRLEQIPDEFDWWIQCLLRADVGSLLTIGAGWGGVEWHVARKYQNAGRTISIHGVDRVASPALLNTFQDIRSRFGQDATLITGESTASNVRSQLRKQYDAVFIDADHSFAGIQRDVDLAMSLTPSIVGLHDMVDSDWHASAGCCVSRLWNQLVANYVTDERKSREWGGIGVVWPKERR